MDNVSCALWGQGVTEAASVGFFISLISIQASQEPLPLWKMVRCNSFSQGTHSLLGTLRKGHGGSCARTLRDMLVSSHWVSAPEDGLGVSTGER